MTEDISRTSPTKPPKLASPAPSPPDNVGHLPAPFDTVQKVHNGAITSHGRPESRGSQRRSTEEHDRSSWVNPKRERYQASFERPGGISKHKRNTGYEYVAGYRYSLPEAPTYSDEYRWASTTHIPGTENDRPLRETLKWLDPTIKLPFDRLPSTQAPEELLKELKASEKKDHWSHYTGKPWEAEDSPPRVSIVKTEPANNLTRKHRLSSDTMEALADSHTSSKKKRVSFGPRATMSSSAKEQLSGGAATLETLPTNAKRQQYPHSFVSYEQKQKEKSNKGMQTSQDPPATEKLRYINNPTAIHSQAIIFEVLHHNKVERWGEAGLPYGLFGRDALVLVGEPSSWIWYGDKDLTTKYDEYQEEDTLEEHFARITGTKRSGRAYRRINNSAFEVSAKSSSLPEPREIVSYPHIRPFIKGDKLDFDEEIWDTKAGLMRVKWVYWAVVEPTEHGPLAVPFALQKTRGTTSWTVEDQETIFPVRKTVNGERYDDSPHDPFKITSNAAWKEFPGTHLMFNEQKVLPTTELTHRKQGFIEQWQEGRFLGVAAKMKARLCAPQPVSQTSGLTSTVHNTNLDADEYFDTINKTSANPWEKLGSSGQASSSSRLETQTRTDRRSATDAGREGE